VWDVNCEAGYWVAVPDAIASLDKINPTWRDQKEQQSEPTVMVRLPSAHTTNDDGFLLLRLLVVKHCFPQVRNWYLKNLSLEFPKTPEAQADLEKFLHNQATGETVTISGEYRKLSDRDARVLGPINSWPSTLTVGTEPSKEIFPVKLEIMASDGTIAEVPYLELRLVKRGHEQTTFSNYHAATPFSKERTATPFCFSLVLERGRDDYNISFTTQGSRPTAKEARAALPFLNAFVAGGKFRWTLLSNPNQRERSWHEFAPSGKGYSAYFSWLLDVLCLIEDKVGCTFTLADWHISLKDADIIKHILGAIATGRVFRDDHVVHLRFKKVALLRRSKSRMEALLNDLRHHAGYTELVDEIEDDCYESKYST